MTTITASTLCVCRHIRANHCDVGEDCAVPRCNCAKFQVSARCSSSHYQRGQATTRKRVTQLRPGDRILVTFTDDGTLLVAQKRTGALVAKINHTWKWLSRWDIDTDLGTLSFPNGSYAMHVLAEGASW